MGAGTIPLIAVAVLITVIMYRVADGVHGTADAASVAVRGADAGGEPPVVGARPGDVVGGTRADHGARGGRRGCC